MPDLEVVTLVARARDESTDVLTRAAASVDRFGDSVVRSGGKIREFRKLGGELGVVGQTLGGSFATATNAVQDFTTVAGSGGLALRGIIDLAPIATASMTGLAASLALVAAPLLVLTVGIGAFVIAAQRQVTEEERVQTATEVLGTRMDLLNRQLAAGQISQDRYNESVSRLTPQIHEQTGAVHDLDDAQGKVTNSTVYYTSALHDLDGAQGLVNDGLTGLAEILARGPAYWSQYTNATKDTGAGLDGVGNRAIAAANNINTAGAAAVNTANDMYALAAALAAAGQSTSQGKGVGAAGLQSGNVYGANGYGNVGSDSGDLAGSGSNFPKVKKATGAKGGSASSAKAAAASIKTDYQAAFNAAEQTATKFYKSVHDSNEKAIKDAHTRASAEISEERRAVDARLQARKALNAAPVTAAEQALAATQSAQQERDLRESLATAQAGTTDQNGINTVDQTQVRDANEALQNFLAQQNIDLLKSAQASADAQAEADAANENKKLDVKQAAADRQQVLDLAANDKKYNAQVKAYDKESALLEKHLEKIHATHKKVVDEINALYDELGVGKGKGGGSGGASVIINVNGGDPQAVVAALKQEMNRQGMTLSPATGF